MAKFNYRFSSLKKTKEVLEKRIMEEAASIQREIENKEADYKNLLDMIKNSEVLESRMKVSSVQFNISYKNKLKNDLASKKEEINILLGEKEMKMEELIQKSKEHKILTKLEEFYYEKFLKEENRKEMELLNEIAIRKYSGKEN